MPFVSATSLIGDLSLKHSNVDDDVDNDDDDDNNNNNNNNNYRKQPYWALHTYYGEY